MAIKNLLSVFLLIICSTSYADTSIIGEWSGIDSDGDATTFLFNEDKSAEVIFEGLPPLTTKNLTNGNVEWSKDTNHNPMHLDIIIFINSEEQSRIPMLAEFVDNETLKIQMSRNMKTRPQGFEITKDVFQILAKKQ